jgi:signal transduction histidine kinase
MDDDLVKHLRDLGEHAIFEPHMHHVAADRIEELAAENKRLNEQMDSIEEMGTESLNALPDCLMRLAPALVENDDLKVKLAKAVAFIEDLIGCEWPYNAQAERILAELKGEADG